MCWQGRIYMGLVGAAAPTKIYNVHYTHRVYIVYIAKIFYHLVPLKLKNKKIYIVNFAPTKRKSWICPCVLVKAYFTICWFKHWFLILLHIFEPFILSFCYVIHIFLNLYPSFFYLKIWTKHNEELCWLHITFWGCFLEGYKDCIEEIR